MKKVVCIDNEMMEDWLDTGEEYYIEYSGFVGHVNAYDKKGKLIFACIHEDRFKEVEE